MRTAIIALAAGLPLAACNPAALDASLRQNLPRMCEYAGNAHASFTLATMTGYVPANVVVREAQAWAVMRRLCVDPEHATSADVLLAAVEAYTVINSALDEAQN